jgi:hypothetical protein
MCPDALHHPKMIVKSDSFLIDDPDGEKREMTFDNATGIRVIIQCLLRQDRWKLRASPRLTLLKREDDGNVTLFAFPNQPIQSHGDLRLAMDEAVRELGEHSDPCLIRVCSDISESIAPVNSRSILTVGRKKFFLWHRTYDYREVLHLGASYDAFLASLGKLSRRNIRRAQKAAQKHRLSHLMEPATPHTSLELLNLGPHTHPVAFGPEKIVVLNRLVANQARGFYSILRLESGVMISCCAGYIEGGRAFIVFQLNHRDHLKYNPCLTNRALLIQHLIPNQISNLTFINGCQGVLGHACVSQPSADLLVVRLSFRAMIKGLRFFVRSYQNPIHTLPASFLGLLRTRWQST